MTRIIVLAVLLIAASIAQASCGGPSSPDGTTSNDRLQLPTGSYTLFLSSSAASCTAQGPINPSFQLPTRVTLTHEVAEWVARSSTSADGDIELRFHDTGGSVIIGTTTVSGAIHGSGAASNDPPSVRRTITFGGAAGATAAQMQGNTTTPISPVGVLGGVSGVVTLVDSVSGVVSCSSVALSLQLGAR
jgi:hypothetical protein